MPDTKFDPDMLKVTVIGGTGTGTGTGDGQLMTGTIGKTPAHQPNVVFNVVQPVVAIAVRFAHAYGATLLGLMTGIPLMAKITVGDSEMPIVPFSDFWDLLLKSSTLALAGPLVEMLRDIVAIFSKLKDKFPLLSGNV